MSTFSLFSSSLMTAVFLESLMSCRLAERLVVIVRTFQHLSFKSGLFDNFVCGCLVPWFQSAFRVSLIPMHPERMADRGGTAPYWLWAAQLEVGDSCPVRSEDLSHRRKQPLAPCSTPIERWLITGICYPVLCQCRWRSWSVLSRCGSRCRWLNGCKPGQCYVEDRLLPMQHAPPPPPPSLSLSLSLSTSMIDPKEQQGHYSLAPVTSQVLPE